MSKPAHNLHSQSRRSGFSYIEILLTAVIISILLVAALRLFGNIGRSRRSVTDHDGAEFLALQMIEEIKRLPYQDPVFPDEFGPGADEAGNRAAFDDVDDYDGWEASPPQSRDGTEFSLYADLTRCVTVSYVAADNFEQHAPSDEGFKKVTITISNTVNELTRHKYIIADAPGFGGRSIEDMTNHENPGSKQKR